MHLAITGASSGIGEGIADYFAARGHKLTLVARRDDLLKSLAARLGGDPHIVRRDLTLLDTCSDWIQEAEKVHGPIDVLINNAGVQFVEPALGVTDDRADSILRLNYIVPLRLMRCVLPSMIARGGGTIVNVSSVAGLVATPNMAHYSASKAALAMASEMMRVELAAKKIHVLTVYPGPVTSPMEAAAREKIENRGGFGARVSKNLPTGTVKGLSAAIDKAIRSKKARVIYPRMYWLSYWFRSTAQWITSAFTPLLE